MITIGNDGKPIRVSARLPKGSDWKSDLNMPHPNDDVEFVKPDPQNDGRDKFKSLKRAVEDYCSVNHPEHYNTGDYECIDVMEECFGTEAVKDFCVCNAFKYLWRCKEKHETPIEDIKKAVWYLKKYLELCKYE